MKNEKSIISTFELLNSENIKYVVLRDYESIDNIINSIDIDIYVDKIYKKKLHKILVSNGWYTCKFNDNKLSHKQYTKIIDSKIMKLDFVFELRYGRKNYYIKNLPIIFSYNRKLENIIINDENTAIITMLLHVLFDKEKLSKKNFEILNSMYNDCKKNEEKSYSFFINLCEEILNDNKFANNLSYYQKKIIDKEILEYNIIENCLDMVRINFMNLFHRICQHISKKSISIIGVDGSGKSTAIKTLSQIYGNKSIIVYMGLREFNIKFLKKVYTNNFDYNTISSFSKIKIKFMLFFELFIRYFKYRFTSKIIIFDRYSEDYYLNSTGKMQNIDKFLYKIIFPKTSISFYFKCSIKTSYSRKDDIYNKKAFVEMKKRYDKYFKNKKNIKIVDTDKYNQDEVINIICEHINKEFVSSTY